MPYDFMNQFSRPGTGFAGRPTGSYFQPYYGSAAEVVTPSPAIAPPPAMMPQQNFFDQMAGLFGMPTQSGPAQNTNPWATQQALNQWSPGKDINFGNVQSAISQMPRDNRPMMLPGGMGMYGGVPREVQEQMFRGQGQAMGRQSSSGRGSQGRTNPLGRMPNRKPMQFGKPSEKIAGYGKKSGGFF